MYKAEDGTVLHDEKLCIGCQACVSACPYDVPQYIPEKKVVGKCDACAAIRAAGGQPACVAACPYLIEEVLSPLKEIGRAHV